MIIRIGIEIIEWISIVLKEKRKETKQNDGKGNSKEKQKSGTTQGNPGGS
jgi:hypothetical protein